MFVALEQAILNRSAKVGVIGLGYVGLPLVRAFVDAGFETLGFRRGLVQGRGPSAGQSYIKHISSQWIAECVASGRFVPTADMRRLGEADALLICVPTPLEREPRPGPAVTSRGRRGRLPPCFAPGQLIVLESTTYPGTTRDVVLPILAGTGLAVGRGLLPGLQSGARGPGQSRATRRATFPRWSAGSSRTAPGWPQLLYGQAVARVVPVSSCEVAEACKILENTYRSVNIAMVNELKMLFDRLGIDVWEVIDAAKTKPFGFQAFLSRAGAGRALHSHRSVLPELAGAAATA